MLTHKFLKKKESLAFKGQFSNKSQLGENSCLTKHFFLDVFIIVGQNASYRKMYSFSSLKVDFFKEFSRITTQYKIYM